MFEVIWDMANDNLLVALAYIKINDNPLEVFCNYILYVLMKKEKHELRIDEVREAVDKKFGMMLPMQMVKVCARILKKNNKVEFLDSGKGFRGICSDFDVDKIDERFRRLHEQENKLLTSMIEFIKQEYSVNWNVDDSKKYISKFLNDCGNGAKLFLNGELEINEEKVLPNWYIGRYINSLEKTSLEWQYLVEIVNGFMIYQGINEINDYEQDKNQKFTGTHFYFDTKLILRAMGYSWPVQVQETSEFIDLLTKEYGGRIAVFSETVREISHALLEAGTALKYKNEISDMELKSFARLNPEQAELFSDMANIETIKRWLAEHNILYNDKNEVSIDSKYSIPEKEIGNFIKAKYPNWNKNAIENDMSVINRISSLRKGDYSVKYGGKKRLPVFVTTNSALVYGIREYVDSAKDCNLNIHALPVVTDVMILFRLWVPYAKNYSNLPAITLSRYANSVQNKTSAFFDKLREKAIEYQKTNKVDFINLSEARREKLEDIIVEKSDGEINNITNELFATSVDELIKWENIDLHNKLDIVQKNYLQQQEIIDIKNKEINDLILEPLYNKIGFKNRFKLIFF